MEIFSSIEHARCARLELRKRGSTLALVPTMGYLHEGHLSLVRKAQSLADATWVSIFVNPTQFGPNEDLNRYPRDLDRDFELLQIEGVDAVFVPSAEEMYAKKPIIEVAFSGLENMLCGASRPVHFGGVGIVVTKLFNIIEPDVAVFGQKDAQQALLIRRLVDDLSFAIRIEVAPTVREADGLALSSRNVNLTDEERRAAPAIHRALIEGQRTINTGENNPDRVLEVMRKIIGREELLRLDYAVCVSADDLSTPKKITGPVLLAIAVNTSATRLIDNIIVELGSPISGRR